MPGEKRWAGGGGRAEEAEAEGKADRPPSRPPVFELLKTEFRNWRSSPVSRHCQHCAR